MKELNNYDKEQLKLLQGLGKYGRKGFKRILMGLPALTPAELADEYLEETATKHGVMLVRAAQTDDSRLIALHLAEYHYRLMFAAEVLGKLLDLHSEVNELPDAFENIFGDLLEQEEVEKE